MFYNDPVKTENGRLTLCPVCSNEEFSDNAEYCRICGTPRVNYCIPEEQNWHQHKNPANARYCETCGAQTTFLFHGLLKYWKDVPDEYKSATPLQEPSTGGSIPGETDELPF